MCRLCMHSSRNPRRCKAAAVADPWIARFVTGRSRRPGCRDKEGGVYILPPHESFREAKSSRTPASIAQLFPARARVDGIAASRLTAVLPKGEREGGNRQ